MLCQLGAFMAGLLGWRNVRQERLRNRNKPRICVDGHVRAQSRTPVGLHRPIQRATGMRGMNEEARTTIRRKLLFIMAFRGVAALAFILGARYLADRIVEWVPAWQGPVEAVLPLVVGLGGGLLIGPIFRMKSRE
jgi:hypothetical protein